MDERRERLIQLLSQYFDIGDSYTYNLTRVKTAFDVGTIGLDDFEEYTEDDVASLADYLLEEGAILPLVKVGQAVWYLNTRWSMYMKKDAIYEAIINRVYIGKKNTLVLSVLIKQADGITEHSGIEDIGKTVFLTREAAEAALKARDKQ